MVDTYQAQYQQASLQTAEDLQTIATSPEMRALSSLSLPQISVAVDIISRLIPAGNVPAMILSGLSRLPGRQAPVEQTRQHINLLFKGIEKMLDRAVYGAFFAGPAAVIWGYQNLIKLAGKEPENAFPEGLWQFYADYALREDTARFTVETHGFDTTLKQHHIQLSPADRITAWIMTAIHTLHEYPTWLKNDWRERVYTDILTEVTKEKRDAAWYAGRYRAWEKKRPYGRRHDAAANENYARYRRRKFDDFLRQALDQLDEQMRYQWNKRVQEAKTRLPAYQAQMSILAYLEAGPYGETRHPIPLADCHIGLIHKGYYHLIPACQPTRMRPPDFNQVQAQVTAILQHQSDLPATPLIPLATMQRHDWATFHKQLKKKTKADFQQLRLAPILINSDQQTAQQPLSTLRQKERGVGSHPLTLFDATNTFTFDFSHIFFDGAGAAALAEILTQEALAWAVYLNHHSTKNKINIPKVEPLAFNFTPDEWRATGQAATVAVEVTAETTAVNLQQIKTLRHLFKMRSDLLRLTVNDLLILYRAIHAATYRPATTLIATIEKLRGTPQANAAVSQTLTALQSHPQNPTVLIPMDAAKRDPKERVYPLVFEVPLHDLDLLKLHQDTADKLLIYKDTLPPNRDQAYQAFDESQRHYLGTLAGFGQVMSKAKQIAGQGEGASQGAIRLLAHLPTPLQRLLDQIPNRIDVLNDMLKGKEVFSNVGVVVSDSSVSRFNTAKDDNDKKILAWGVVTDAEGVMHLSLRDFRPHVAALVAIGQPQLAQKITQDYLDAYAHGFNGFIDTLRRITKAVRETQGIPTK